jgi:hypothetical protein
LNAKAPFLIIDIPEIKLPKKTENKKETIPYFCIRPGYGKFSRRTG